MSSPAPVSPDDLQTLLLPAGYGFSLVTAAELRETRSLFDMLHIWEAPRRRGRRAYVLSADVSDGMGQDRSVLEVIRLGTIEEPAEQVAELVTDSTSPADLAYLLQAVGEYYRDQDNIEALVAIECNNHGLSTQDTLQLHLGYMHFYRWEYYDAADPSSRYSTKIGWYTTPRTRPMLLDKFRTALTTLDPLTGFPDLITHSPILHDELQDFQTQGALWEAAASRGAHDDTVMATAIGYYVAYRLQAGETEPLEDRRRRRSEQQLLIAQTLDRDTRKIDYRNTPTSSTEADTWGAGERAPDDDLDSQLYDPRGYEEPYV